MPFVISWGSQRSYDFLLWQVDPGNTGRVGPTEAALFLKKSGLPDITLGKVKERNASVWKFLIFLKIWHSDVLVSSADLGPRWSRWKRFPGQAGQTRVLSSARLKWILHHWLMSVWIQGRWSDFVYVHSVCFNRVFMLLCGSWPAHRAGRMSLLQV